jgi:hypothetical protein
MTRRSRDGTRQGDLAGSMKPAATPAGPLPPLSHLARLAAGWISFRNFNYFFTGPSLQNHARLCFRPDYYVYCLGYPNPYYSPWNIPIDTQVIPSFDVDRKVNLILIQTRIKQN